MAFAMKDRTVASSASRVRAIVMGRAARAAALAGMSMVSSLKRLSSRWARWTSAAVARTVRSDSGSSTARLDVHSVSSVAVRCPVRCESSLLTRLSH